MEISVRIPEKQLGFIGNCILLFRLRYLGTFPKQGLRLNSYSSIMLMSCHFHPVPKKLFRTIFFSIVTNGSETMSFKCIAVIRTTILFIRVVTAVIEIVTSCIIWRSHRHSLSVDTW